MPGAMVVPELRAVTSTVTAPPGSTGLLKAAPTISRSGRISSWAVAALMLAIATSKATVAVIRFFMLPSSIV